MSSFSDQSLKSQYVVAISFLLFCCGSEPLAGYEAGHTTIDEWIFRGTLTGPLTLPNGETIAPTGKRISVPGIDISAGRFGDSVVPQSKETPQRSSRQTQACDHSSNASGRQRHHRA
jgi:hypothetical protein